MDCGSSTRSWLAVAIAVLVLVAAALLWRSDTRTPENGCRRVAESRWKPSLDAPCTLVFAGAKRKPPEPFDLTVSSAHLHDDLFSAAPVGWRTAGVAIAEVTNRWQCDPRWSFFSLKNDRSVGKAAALWSKYLYPGDVKVEFYVGLRQNGSRGIPFMDARDINVTICGDGSDLCKGYTFMWGAHGNKDSVILRNGVEVRRHSARIPTDMNYLRYWFRYRVEKVGGRLTFCVDRLFSDENKEAELVFEDPQPLQGDRVAIWTYDHAVMLSRVRISGDGGVMTESPDFQPGPLKTPYDDK